MKKITVKKIQSGNGYIASADGLGAVKYGDTKKEAKSKFKVFLKKIGFLFLILPAIVQGQNYLFEITPTAGEFRVLITDDTREAYPRDITDFGLVDTATLQLLAHQRIEQAKSRQSSLLAQSFLAALNAEQTASGVGAVVPIDYAAFAAAQWATAYDGNYQYQVRGTATNFGVYIDGAELRRTSNNNLLATITPQSANWFTATNGGVPVQLYQAGNIWVGRNANNQIVTLKRL